MKKYLIADLVKAAESEKELDILDIMDKWELSRSDAEYLYDNYKKTEYKSIVEIATKLKISVKDVLKDSGTNHIPYLVQQVQADKISLDAAQEDAWVYYGYPEGSTKSGPKSSKHGSTTWGELFGGESSGEITVTYEPIFESLGDTLDDTPYWEVYITIDTEGKYPHHYEGSAPNKQLEAIEALESTSSVMSWFNQYCGDHRFG
jgi:hypothetical protein